MSKTQLCQGVAPGNTPVGVNMCMYEHMNVYMCVCVCVCVCVCMYVCMYVYCMIV